MTFTEYAIAHGLESACKLFKVGPELFIDVHPKRYVTAHCGSWRGSEPLGMGQDVDDAINTLINALHPHNPVPRITYHED